MGKGASPRAVEALFPSPLPGRFPLLPVQSVCRGFPFGFCHVQETSPALFCAIIVTGAKCRVSKQLQQMGMPKAQFARLEKRLITLSRLLMQTSEPEDDVCRRQNLSYG